MELTWEPGPATNIEQKHLHSSIHRASNNPPFGLMRIMLSTSCHHKFRFCYTSKHFATRRSFPLPTTGPLQKLMEAHNLLHSQLSNSIINKEYTITTFFLLLLFFFPLLDLNQKEVHPQVSVPVIIMN